MDKTFIVVLIFVGKSYFIDSFGPGQDGLLLIGSESGIGFIEGPPDEWSASNKSVFVVQSLNLTREGRVNHLAGQFANDVLLWFHPGDSGSILYTTGRVRAKNLSSPILHFHDRCSGQVNGISVDWLNENVYWIDAAYNWVKMAALANPRNYVKVVVDEGISNPTALTLYPQKSYIFWADSDFGVIKRSDLSGGEQVALVSNPGQRVIALEADYVMESVIWLNVADPSSATIERITVNGLQRTIVFASPRLKAFADLTLYNNLTFLVEYNQSELGILGKNELSNVFLSPPQMSYNAIYMFRSELQEPSLTTPCSAARCQHFCVTVNSNTRVRCFCGLGYHLSINGFSCQGDVYLVPPKYLVFLGSTLGYVSFYEVWAPDWSERSHQVLLDGLNSLTAMAMSFQGRFLYIAHSEGYIEMISLISSDSLRSRKYRGVGRIEGISVDWISSNVYWTDRQRGYIMAARSDLSSSILLHEKVSNPSGIAVDAPNRRIFWCENGRSPAIMTSSTDGSGRSRFIYSDLISPEKLVIDNTKQRLYWTDSGKGTVEFISLVGNQNRLTLVKRPPAAFLYGISVFQDYVAWTERGTSRGIFWKLNSDHDSSTFKTFYHLTNPPGEILLYGKFAQPEEVGACSIENGGCSQLCLPRTNSSDHVCVCSVGYDLAKDNSTCLPHVLDHTEDSFLLLVDAFRPAIYQLDIDTEVPCILPLPPDQQPTVVTMDRQNRTLYWSDVANSVIHRRLLDQNTSEIFLQLPKGSGVYSIALDENNDFLYFTLNTSGVIYASPTNATNQTVALISRLQHPRDVTVDAAGRVIYWTEVGRIGRAKLDSLNESVYVVISDQLTRLQGLAVHPQWNRLFWCNGSLVYMSDLNGGNITIIANLNPSVVCVDVAAYDDVLYALDSNNQHLICINWIQGTYYNLEKMPYQQLTAIHIVPILRKKKVYEVQSYSDSGKNGVIVGSVLGSAVLILAIVILVLWIYWRKNKRPQLTRQHQPQKPHHPSDSNPYLSPIRISDDISHVSYYAKGVFRSSPGELHGSQSSGHNLPFYNSWSNGHYQQSREHHDSGVPGKDQTSEYDTSSVISDASSTSPFVKMDSEKLKKKRGRKKNKAKDSGNRSHSQSIYYSPDEHFVNDGRFPSFGRQTGRRNSSHDLTISPASAFHAQSFFSGRSWGDTLSKKF